SNKPSETDKITEKIKKLKSLSELQVKDFAKRDGYAEKIAKDNKKDLKTSQLRKIFGAVQQIKTELSDKNWSEVEADFYLLQPMLAYAKARNLIPDKFLELMKVCMDKIDVGEDEDSIKENYNQFVMFLESIVAYHKYYNPKA
ncbi:MAG: type III-A CRISPR-associated protein Csm2, partial [Methanosarcinales archaeon]